MSAWGDYYRKTMSKLFAFFVATVGKQCVKLILSTCKWEAKGLEDFYQAASENKCILMLWHNRLAITSFIIERYGKQFKYVAFVSNSRDGELIDALVNSYHRSRTIKVPHQSRHEALRTLIRAIQNSDEIAVITPDGPRGPKYEIKPGITLAATMTQAKVIPFTWQSDRYWELKSWDKLRFPKPFSKIQVNFEKPLQFSKKDSLEYVQEKLRAALTSD